MLRRGNACGVTGVLPPDMGSPVCRLRHVYRAQVSGESMDIGLYRFVHWLAIVALVVWAVYSAYSAIIFS
jgi:hypothetical protein